MTKAWPALPNTVVIYNQAARVTFAPMPKKNYLEIYQAQQLLRLLDSTDGLALPVCVEPCDKPDFILSTRSYKIGLEITSFTDEEVMRAEYLHFTRFPDACITTTGLRDGASRRSNKQIAETNVQLARRMGVSC